MNDIIVVTKSTVPVGTNDVMKGWIEEKLKGRHTVHIVSNPEFCVKVQVFMISFMEIVL